MTDLEKGYIAGLIDGEGSVSLYKDHADQKFRYPAIENNFNNFAYVRNG